MLLPPSVLEPLIFSNDIDIIWMKRLHRRNKIATRHFWRKDAMLRVKMFTPDWEQREEHVHAGTSHLNLPAY